MASNFNLVKYDDEGAIIRVHFDDHLVDCRWPEGMPDSARMGWLKQTANEYLKNRKREDLCLPVPLRFDTVHAEDGSIERIDTFFAESNNVENLPDTDDPVAAPVDSVGAPVVPDDDKPGFFTSLWKRVFG